MKKQNLINEIMELQKVAYSKNKIVKITDKEALKKQPIDSLIIAYNAYYNMAK